MKHQYIIAFALLIMTHACGEELCTLEHAMVSIYAVRSDTGEVLMDKNSDLSLMPASCMKIVTTAAALHLLGADHHFETSLEYDGLIDHTHTLYGNIYIRGGGDPCLGSDRLPSALPWQKQIATWADAIQKLGIQNIAGQVIGDATKWEKALAPPSWSWEDLGNYYGAGACALSFHENCYSLFLRPGSTMGENVSILHTDPPLSLTFHNEMKTGAKLSGDHACIYGSEYSSLQFIRGTIGAAVHEFVIKGAIPDPAASCADLLTQELQARGLHIKQQEMSQQSKRVVFHTTHSPSVQEIVHSTLHKSLNLYAEHLLKKMGEVTDNEGSTSAGVKAVIHFLHSKNIDLAGFNMVDGSGLSRKNLVTTKQLVEILLMMKKSPLFPIFFDSLPQKDHLIRAKSGSLSLVKGYAGYTGNVVFAILINHCLDHQMMNETINTHIQSLKNFSCI